MIRAIRLDPERVLQGAGRVVGAGCLLGPDLVATCTHVAAAALGHDLHDTTSANDWSRKTYGKEFDRLSPADREAALKMMESGKAEFVGIPSNMFFDGLLQITMEGFFSDPIYGGNRNMAAWKMVGYPGLPATYREEIKTYFGKKYDKPPQSIADFA